MSDETRVVLVKPGDVLLIGNVGAFDDSAMEALAVALAPLKLALGLATDVLVFEADIDLGVLPAGG